MANMRSRHPEQYERVERLLRDAGFDPQPRDIERLVLGMFNEDECPECGNVYERGVAMAMHRHKAHGVTGDGIGLA